MKRLLARCVVIALALVPLAASAQNLSTSRKTVADLNGGDPDPGDTLRYSVTLVESAGVAAAGVRVADDLSARLGNLAVVSIPAGAVDASTGAGTGANGTGRVDVGNIFVPANGSVVVVFDARIAAGTPPLTPIDNTATVTNPGGPGAAPSSPQLVVSPSAVPSSGTKPLYVRSAPALALSRTPPGADPTTTVSPATPAVLTLTPTLALPVSVPAGNISVPLWLGRSGGDQTRTLRVTLENTVTGVIGSATLSPQLPVEPTPFPALVTFVIPNSVARTFPVGSAFRLTVAQLAPTTAGRTTLLRAAGPTAGAFSHVSLNSATVINVNSVQTYSAAYPGGALQSSFSAGSTAYVRAVISDPFGSFDIASARISIIDAASAVRVTDAAMTRVADSGGATRTYEFAYVIPGGAQPGGWSARVTGVEGTEAVVTHTRAAGFAVLPTFPALRVTKNVEVLSDPVNGTANPLQIPGSLQRYRVTVTNTGAGWVDASTLVIADIVPANAELVVAGAAPVQFLDGSVPSGLTFAYPSNVTYSNQPGGAPPYNYVPVANGNGVDPSVTALRIAPTGSMTGAAGASQPSFSVEFRVRVR